MHEAFKISDQPNRIQKETQRCRLGSVEDYAARYNEDPAAAVADAKARGHELYWANPQGVMLTAGKQDHKWVRGISHGDTITFKGKTFRVDPASNRNVKLVEV